MSYGLIPIEQRTSLALATTGSSNPSTHASNSGPISATNKNPTSGTNSDNAGTNSRSSSIEDVFRRLEAYEHGLRECNVACDKVHFVDDAIILDDTHEVQLPANGLRRVCEMVSAPSEYVLRLDPDVRNFVLEQHFKRGDAPARVTIVSRDGELVGLSRPDLFRLPATDALQAVCDGIGTTALVAHKLRIDDEIVQLELVNPSIPEEVSPGDVMLSGLQLTHSLLGTEATKVQAFILRLACANGMTHRQCVTGRNTRTRRLPATHPEARERQKEQVRQLAKASWTALQGKLHAIRALQFEEVEVEGFLRRWLERGRLSVGTLLPLLLAAWEVEGGRATAYDLMNALTRVATHDTTIGLRQRRVLAGLAGILAFRRVHFCPRCFSALHGSESVGA